MQKQTTREHQATEAPDHAAEAADHHDPVSHHDPVRRSMLAALGGTLGILAGSSLSPLAAQGEDKESEGVYRDGVFSSYYRPKRFENNEMDGRPWIAPETGNFDTNDPWHNRLARMKMSNNLSGKRTYVPMLIRKVLARDNTPGGVLLGSAAMFTWQLQVPDPAEFPDAPEGSMVMRTVYTALYLDPKTMEPVEHLVNPFNGVAMELEDYLSIETFLLYPTGGSRLVQEPEFMDDDPDAARLTLIKQWGDDAILFMGGTYSEPGLHQPRFTELQWRCSYADLMDPEKDLIESAYSFTGISKAYEKPWTGYSHEDGEMLVDSAIGRKYHSVEDIPDYHKRVLVEKYPDRV